VSGWRPDLGLSPADRQVITTALPGYSLGAELGRGASGYVIGAHHRTLDRDVAIKVVATPGGADGLRRFELEARILAAVDHPHVVTVHDCVTASGLCLMIMELLPGGTLKDRMRTGTPTPAQAVAVAVDALRGLEAAHSRGVLHRDVKPANLMFSRAGVLKVTDFGVAKFVSGDASTSHMIRGTPIYMAPEQARGNLSPASDIYSLGLILYELLNGSIPVDPGSDLVSLLVQRSLAPPPSLHQTAPAVPPSIAALCMSALAPAPEARPSSAGQMARLLESAATGEWGPGWRSGGAARAASPAAGLLPPTIPKWRALTPATPPPPAPSTTPPPLAPPTAPPPLSPPAAGSTISTDPIQGPLPTAAWRATEEQKHSRLRLVALAAAAALVVGGGTFGGIEALTGHHHAPPAAVVAGGAIRPAPAIAPDQLSSLKPGQVGLLAGRPSAAQVSLLGPSAVAVDRAGDLYVAEAGAARITEVTTTGQVSTVYGPAPGSPGVLAQENSSGSTDCLLAGMATGPDGYLYVLCGHYGGILRISPAGAVSTVLNGEGSSRADGVPLSEVQLAAPSAIAVDAKGDIFYADAGAHVVREVTTGNAVRTIAGNGKPGATGDGGPARSAELQDPQGLAVDSAGDVYIAEGVANRVRVVHTDGTIATFAGNGQNTGGSADGTPAVSTSIVDPAGLAVGADDSVYVTSGSTIVHVKGGVATSIAGGQAPGFNGPTGDGGSAQTAQLDPMSTLAVDRNGDVYFDDLLANRVREVSADGNVTTVLGDGQSRSSGNGGAATDASLNLPDAVVWDDGSVLVAEGAGGQVRRISPNGTITDFAGTGPCTAVQVRNGEKATDACLQAPDGLAVDGRGDVYIADGEASMVYEVSPDGNIKAVAGGGQPKSGVGDGGPATGASLLYPSGLAVNAAGDLFIADTGHNRVRELSHGDIKSVAGNGGNQPTGDHKQAKAAGVDAPGGLAFDAAGDLFVVEGSGAVRQISPNGTITTVSTAIVTTDALAGAGQHPYSIAIGPLGEIYEAVSIDNRVRRFGPQAAPSGEVVAGSGSDRVGDGDGTATGTSIPGPCAMALAGQALIVVSATGEVFAVGV
jgi:serine/threonine-protein kinase